METTFKPLKITFELESNVFFNPSEPIMLDALLAWCLMPYKRTSAEPPRRDEQPEDITLPLARWELGGTWGWHASALLPEGEVLEHLVYWRKRVREDRLTLAAGSVNPQNGPYRGYNVPMPVVAHCSLVGYLVGDRRRVRRELKRVKYLGKKRSMGIGRVSSLSVDVCEEDRSLVFEGMAMRWLPMDGGRRDVRPRPPYWNSCGRVACCEVGDGYVLP